VRGIARRHEHHGGHGGRARDGWHGQRHEKRLAVAQVAEHALRRRKTIRMRDEEQDDAAGDRERDVRQLKPLHERAPARQERDQQQVGHEALAQHDRHSAARAACAT
jgi:hypothetical protein